MLGEYVVQDGITALVCRLLDILHDVLDDVGDLASLQDEVLLGVSDSLSRLLDFLGLDGFLEAREVGGDLSLEGLGME